MKSTVARKRRPLVLAGAAAVCLAGLSAGVPAVMASVRSAPGVRSAPPVPVPSGWPAAKASGLQAENNLRQAAAGRPLVAPAVPASGRWQAAGPSAGTAAGPAATATQAGLTPGILPLTAGGPFSSSQFIGTNLWNGPVHGQWEVVQAGGLPTHPALGAASPTSAGLFVYTQPADPDAKAAPTVLGIRRPSPAVAGTFTVRTFADGVLTLSLSGSRASFYFDVATRQFVRKPPVTAPG